MSAALAHSAVALLGVAAALSLIASGSGVIGAFSDPDLDLTSPVDLSAVAIVLCWFYLSARVLIECVSYALT